MPCVQGILLAAGQGRRWKAAGGVGHKLLHPLPGGPLVAVAAAHALRAALPHCLAVVAAHDDELARHLQHAGLRVLRLGGEEGDSEVACEAASGMGDSLARAVRATADAQGWVVALADMPHVQPATVQAVSQAIRAGARCAAPFHQGRRGHPVGFASGLGAALMALRGDRGARGLLEAQGEDLCRLPVDDPGVLWDVDEPSALMVAGQACASSVARPPGTGAGLVADQ